MEDRTETETVSQIEEQSEQPSQEEATWEQRYRSLEGIYKKLKSEADDLKAGREEYVDMTGDELRSSLAQTQNLIAQQSEDIAMLMDHLGRQDGRVERESSLLGSEEEIPKSSLSPLAQRAAERKEHSEQAKLFADIVRDAGYSPTDPRFRECWQNPNPIRAVGKKISEIAKGEAKKVTNMTEDQIRERTKEELQKYFEKYPQAVKVSQAAPTGGGYGFGDIEQAYADGRVTRQAYKAAREKYGVEE
jgi:hypothetical protein